MKPHNLFILTGKKCTLFILYLTLFMGALIDQLGFPGFIKYFNDMILLFIVFFFMKTKFINYMKYRNAMVVVVAFLILIIVSYISAFLNSVPIRLVVWASRNTFRGMLYFFAVLTFLEGETLDNIMNNLYIIQFIHVIFACYQFFILGHEMDFVGGIFGFGNGAGVNTFNALMMTFSINAYLNKLVPLKRLVITVICSFFVAGIAEEKITYVLFLIVIVCALLLSKFSFRKFGVIIVGIMGIVFGLEILYQLYPSMFSVMTNVNNMIDYLSSSLEEGYRLPRLGAFPIISRLFFRNELQYLLGLGFGNCEYSEYAIFQSDFYISHGNWNYRWFTHQWVFLETGYIGFVVYLLFFVAVLVGLLCYRKKCKIKLYNSVGITMTICCICMIWYNATLKVDMAYLAFFSMAIGFTKWNAIENACSKEIFIFKDKK